jgi:alpha-L-fucosidase
MKSILFTFMLLLFGAQILKAQEHEEPYIMPKDPQVVKNIDEWQDLKFGIFMHWGTYSQWGVVESWSICPEDEGWTQRKGPYSQDYFTYKKAYEDLQKTFNPVNFNPEKWATAAKDAGFKYMIVTFKHHDGFCMFDSKYTDYKVTSLFTPIHGQTWAGKQLPLSATRVLKLEPISQNPTGTATLTGGHTFLQKTEM